MSHETVISAAVATQNLQQQEYWSNVILAALVVSLVLLGVLAVLLERYVLKRSVAYQCLQRGKLPRKHSWHGRVCPPPPNQMWLLRHRLRLILNRVVWRPTQRSGLSRPVFE